MRSDQTRPDITIPDHTRTNTQGYSRLIQPEQTRATRLGQTKQEKPRQNHKSTDEGLRNSVVSRMISMSIQGYLKDTLPLNQLPILDHPELASFSILIPVLALKVMPR